VIAMAKRILDNHPEIRDHILLLSQYGHSAREIAGMVSAVKGFRVSHDTVWRVVRNNSDMANQLSDSQSDKSPGGCPECTGRLFQIADPSDPDRIVCQVCGLVLERRIRYVVPRETQIESYMPSNKLNFTRLGQGNPEPLLIDAINKVNPQFKRRNGNYRDFMLKLWELKAHLGIDNRLKKLKDRASKRLAELGFNKKKHFVISDQVGRLIESFYERHVRALPGCFQVKNYSLIIDSALAIILESYYPENKCSPLQADFRIKLLMKQFLPKRVAA